MWSIIGTWRMSLEAIEEASEILKNGGSSGDAVEKSISIIEDFPYFKSVGYGGLPNEEMEVELDSAFMDGDTFNIGAVAAIKDFANPIKIARCLSYENVNNILVGEGAEKYAHKNGFERKNMLSDRAKIYYSKRLKEQDQDQELRPYKGHDTVGIAALDSNGTITVGTSTSGLFMKRKGRVGDSPISGSGFYADSEIGAATATGLGEDLMKGCISYEIVRLMKEGYSPQKACEKAVFELEKKLIEKKGKAGDLSVVAVNSNGEIGAASNIDNFSFVVMNEKMNKPIVYLLKRKNNTCELEIASDEWLKKYMEDRMKPITIE